MTDLELGLRFPESTSNLVHSDPAFRLGFPESEIDEVCRASAIPSSPVKGAALGLVLDSNELIQKRMMHKILSGMALTHEETHKSLLAQLDVVVLAHGEMLIRGEFL